MLTDMHIAVIGGDARQLEVIRMLTEMDARISLVGFDQLDHGFPGAAKKEINELKMSDIDAILLPVAGTNNEGEVETIFSRQKTILTQELLSGTPLHCTVFSGISNQYLDGITSKAKRRLVKLFERDDVAIYNAVPTVEGTIMMVIQNTDFTIHNANIAVLGMGRVGQGVARTFAALGAKVKVGARKTSHHARIYEMGLKPFDLSDLEKEAENVDILINTIPAQVVNAGVLSKMPTHTLVVDLASKPGGTDFRYAEKRGIKALLAPGLPGIVAPKTAGQIIAKVLSTLLHELKTSRKERS
ncbi:dipicolinic acid synthetase subunit A [Bacillus marinisedimentorum]|uniref:dipicolinic acid synthetase subunit A n=1 Tax=Bacillus marinisedimentorum TaxID=1821260 RepID=UPI0007DEF8C5|nr:dipicolinic acid synthetase subunit A [Bacillus marinisedimentorum]